MVGIIECVVYKLVGLVGLLGYIKRIKLFLGINFFDCISSRVGFVVWVCLEGSWVRIVLGFEIYIKRRVRVEYFVFCFIFLIDFILFYYYRILYL